MGGAAVAFTRLSPCKELSQTLCSVLSAAVKIVLEAVCILKGVKPIRMKDAQSGQMVDSYWAASQKMLVDEDFLPSLR